MLTRSSASIPIEDEEWLTQNNVLKKKHLKNKISQKIRKKARLYARANITPCRGTAAVFARALVPACKGKLPDADAIAPTVKAIIDGFVDAGIFRDDSGEFVYLVGYGRPQRDNTIRTREIQIVITDQFVPF